MAGYLREVNLELGMPLVDAAIKRLTFELNTAVLWAPPPLKLCMGMVPRGPAGKSALHRGATWNP